MKKFMKTIVLIPMWPLIWHQVGFNLKGEGTTQDGKSIICSGQCWSCQNGSISGAINVVIDRLTGTWGCCDRANRMLNWWRS